MSARNPATRRARLVLQPQRCRLRFTTYALFHYTLYEETPEMDTFGLKGKSKANDDVFFMERLEMLYEQGLVELRAFAERENRSFDEVSRSGDSEC